MTETNVPLTIHCITALEWARDSLAVPDPERGYEPIPGGEQYICLALEKAAKKVHELDHAAEYLKDVIEDRLEECLALETWLLKRVPEARDMWLTNRPAFDHKAYLTRLAWIDALIEELEQQT